MSWLKRKKSTKELNGNFYISGLCAEEAQIRPQNYYLFKDSSYKNMCEFRGMITIQKINPNDMQKSYDFTTNPKNECAYPSKRSYQEFSIHF